ncbi:shikimate kinase [Oscillochloris sp. ZM17-4]|uniref:shikimate kinase n=1 Tax=Oscillochloris sp. ZM17-4 TaxID=2866714 RepID=UPI001C732EF5|nr:shikimate kinase [Oscillochloris sp. ZM17-4]MBX0329449.1 shikimate kinase [Oscillochloris sp. ZM17-4]
MTAREIYLIGFSGTGKSTVAQLVAAQLGWLAYDLDRIIVERAGVDIPAIFAREGEAGFRDRETEALRGIAGGGPFVAATGGGLPLREENRRLMGRVGWLIALEGRPETLLARIELHRNQEAPDAVRPLLDAESPLEHLRALKERRQPVYALADWTVHTDRLSPAQVAEEIVRAAAILQRSDQLRRSSAASSSSADE